MVRATIGGGAQANLLSFNDIIAHTPGQPGRGDAKKGMYENVNNGDVLVVFSKNPQFVQCEARRNGRRTTRTGFTRTGMAIIDKSTGALRLVAANRDPDGVKQWKEFTGSITLEGNPHVVPTPQGPVANEEYDDEDND